MEWINPVWEAPSQIQSLISTRLGGVSQAPYDSLNLGEHVNDVPEHVAHNRSVLRSHLPSEPVWLKQVHGTIVSTPDQRRHIHQQDIVADAIVSSKPNEVLAIMTADCLPVLFCASDGSVVGAAHAGWRGLCSGVLENTVNEMLALSPHLKSQDILAYMGPAIGPSSYEVGDDVFQAFQESSIKVSENDFVAIPNKQGKYLANLYSLARTRLVAAGMYSISGGQMCTHLDRQHFFSYRRDGITGRFASFIWISE
jgi:YfiH family protein